MRAHWRYAVYLARHKWFVLVAGLRTGAPLWRLLVHDWSKLRPREWFPYVASFYGGYKYSERPAAVVDAFDRAWLAHQHANPHHWQHWLLTEDTPQKYPVWHITSGDGGLVHHSLTEYTRPYDGTAPYPIVAHFNDGLAEDNNGPNQARYLMVSRMLAAANARRPVALPMSLPLVREMVADWMGAGRAITGRWEVREWYARTGPGMVLHPETRAAVEAVLAALPYEAPAVAGARVPA